MRDFTLQSKLRNAYNALTPAEQRYLKYGSLSAAGGIGLASTAGAVDLFTGDQNALNSGELVANYFGSMAAPVGAVIGGGIGYGGAEMLLNKYDNLNDEYYKQRVAKARDIRDKDGKRVERSPEQRIEAQRAFAKEKNAADSIAYQDLNYPINIAKRFTIENPNLFRGSRRAMGAAVGAGVGAVVAGLGATNYMLNDQPASSDPSTKPQSITSNIPMQQLQEISDLLGANGAY